MTLRPKKVEIIKKIKISKAVSFENQGWHWKASVWVWVTGGSHEESAQEDRASQGIGSLGDSQPWIQVPIGPPRLGKPWTGHVPSLGTRSHLQGWGLDKSFLALILFVIQPLPCWGPLGLLPSFSLCVAGMSCSPCLQGACHGSTWNQVGSAHSHIWRLNKERPACRLPTPTRVCWWLQGSPTGCCVLRVAEGFLWLFKRGFY